MIDKVSSYKFTGVLHPKGKKLPFFSIPLFRPVISSEDADCSHIYKAIIDGQGKIIEFQSVYISSKEDVLELDRKEYYKFYRKEFSKGEDIPVVYFSTYFKGRPLSKAALVGYYSNFIDIFVLKQTSKSKIAHDIAWEYLCNVSDYRDYYLFGSFFQLTGLTAMSYIFGLKNENRALKIQKPKINGLYGISYILGSQHIAEPNVCKIKFLESISSQNPIPAKLRVFIFEKIVYFDSYAAHLDFFLLNHKIRTHLISIAWEQLTFWPDLAIHQNYPDELFNSSRKELLNSNQVKELYFSNSEGSLDIPTVFTATRSNLSKTLISSYSNLLISVVSKQFDRMTNNEIVKISSGRASKLSLAASGELGIGNDLINNGEYDFEADLTEADSIITDEVGVRSDWDEQGHQFGQYPKNHESLKKSRSVA